MREEEVTNHPNQLPDNHWLVEEGATKRTWSCYTQWDQGLSPPSQSGLVQVPLPSHWHGHLWPHDQRRIPRGLPPFPDVLRARLAFLLECFLLTHLVLPRAGRAARPEAQTPGSTSFLFSLHPALLQLTSGGGLRKWSGLGPRQEAWARVPASGL